MVVAPEGAIRTSFFKSSVKTCHFTDETVILMCAPFVGRFNFYLFSVRGTEQAEQPLG